VSRLRAAQDAGFLVEAERQLAETLVKAGKLEEAERVAEHARSSVGREDVWSRASTLHALGIVRAAQGRTAEAEALLRESLAIVEPTMYRNLSDQVRASLDELGSTSTAEHSAV
jgi:ATP/maltotriose-dependent transcriptional regulator MalT